MPNMIIAANAERCRDCQVCVLACSLYHERVSNPALARLRVFKDMAHYTFNLRICQHCLDPACLAACSTGALWMDQDGIVHLDDESCVRCGACAADCPYDAIFYEPVSDRYLKCDLCSGRPEGPVCVEMCPVGALSLVARTPTE